MISHLLLSALAHHEPWDSYNWRLNTKYFMNPKDCERFPRGAINLSPGWHEQAKDIHALLLSP
jgi:hypothetical protein